MNRRATPLLAAFVAAAIAFVATACGGGNNTAPTATPPATPEATAETPTEAPQPTATQEATAAATPPTAGATPTPGQDGEEVTHPVLVLVAEDVLWDTDLLEVPAGSEQVTVRVENRDAVPHSFSVYTDATAAEVIFRGDLASGSTTTDYTFDTPSPGTYFFRCDVHPDVQTGTFVVH